MKGREVRMWLHRACVYVMTATLMMQPVTGVQFVSAKVVDAGLESVSEDADAAQIDEVAEIQTESAADENGFDIQDGVLVKYSGTAEVVEIPPSVTKIKDSAFMSCKTVKKVVMSDSVQTVESAAFFSCPELEEVVFGKNTHNITGNAIAYCDKLSKVVLPVFTSEEQTKNVKNLFYYDSYGKMNVEFVIPSESTYFPAAAMNYFCSSITMEAGNSRLSVVDNCVFATETVNGESVTKLVRVPTKITGDFTLPDSTEIIGANAFAGASINGTLTIPASVTTIEKWGVAGLSVNQLVLNAELTSMDEHAFWHDELKRALGVRQQVVLTPAMTAYDSKTRDSVLRGFEYGYTMFIPKDMTEFDAGWVNHMFCQNIVVEEGNPKYKVVDGSLYEIVGEGNLKLIRKPNLYKPTDGVFEIQDGTTVIGNQAVRSSGFYRTPLTTYEGSNVTKAVIPDSVVSIDQNAFYGQKNLSQIELGSGVEYIGKEAFYGVADGCKLVLPKNLKDNVSLGENALGSIKEIVVPNTITPKDLSKFLNPSVAPNLEQVTLDASNPYLKDGAIYSEDGTILYYYVADGSKGFEIPEGVTTIAPFAFSNLKNANLEVTLPESIEKIEANAFVGKSNTNIILHASDTTPEIAPNALKGVSLITIAEKDGPVYEYAEANKIPYIALEDQPHVSLRAPSTVSKNKFSVSGEGNANSKVTIYQVEEGKEPVLVQETMTNRAGYYSAELSFDQLETGDEVTIFAQIENEDGDMTSDSEEQTVRILLECPVIESIQIYASSGVHMVNPRTGQGPVVSYDPRRVTQIVIKLEEGDRPERLYLNDGGKKAIELKYDGATDSYIAQVSGHYFGNDMNLLADIPGKDGTSARQSVMDLNVRWIMDPSGYVYEAFPDQRIVGATVAAYDVADAGLAWDAEPYLQLNPLTTAEDGTYAWDVPKGKWSVKASKEGYYPVETEVFDIPPIRTDINIELKPENRTIQVTGVELSQKAMKLTFDTYVQTETVSAKDVIQLQAEKTPVKIAKVSAIDERIYEGAKVSKAFLFEFEEDLEQIQPEAGFTLKGDSAAIREYCYDGKKEYCQVGAIDVSGLMVSGIVDSISVDDTIVVTRDGNYVVTVQALPADAVKGKNLAIEMGDKETVQVVKATTFGMDGKATLVLKGNKVDSTKMTVSVAGSTEKKTVDMVVAMDDSVMEEICEAISVTAPESITDAQVMEIQNPVITEDKKPAVSENNVDKKPEEDKKLEEEKKPADVTVPVKGKTYTVKNIKYKVTNAKTDGKGTVAIAGASKKTVTSITIPKTVKIDGYTYKVTQIADKAFKGYKKLKKVTIGENVTKIGKNAFESCSKLKNIGIKTTKLTSVGKKALKGVNAKCVIKVPKKKLAKYQKLFKGKGQGKNVKVKK